MSASQTSAPVLGRILPAFDGFEVPGWLLRRVARGEAPGATIFRFANVRDAGQVRELTARLEAALPGSRPLPLLVAADQEGGQLVGLGAAATAFPGAMALGAAGDPGLTRKVGLATARELRALGVTVCYAPVCDLAIEPANLSLGTRSFGSKPSDVAEHAAAFVRGLAEGGVAGVAKHFPGLGAVGVDTHDEVGLVPGDRAALEARELVPFLAAIDAGVPIVMSAHVAVPGLTGHDRLPATLSASLMRDLLRRELGFKGVAMTDAMDMKALAQGAGQLVDAVVALRGGVDLLLATPDQRAQRRLEEGLRQAAERGLLSDAGTRRSLARIRRLRAWLGRFPVPDLSVVRSDAHLRLTRDVAARSITLVRDDDRLLPLRLGEGDRVAVVTPQAVALTPADTSATEALDMAGALRRHHADVVSVRVPSDPGGSDIEAARDQVRGCRAIVVGTIAAHAQRGQADLVRALLATGIPTITVALRTPYDLVAYPEATTHVCSWSIVPASVDALADALVGATPMSGRLPAPIAGLYPVGHRLEDRR